MKSTPAISGKSAAANDADQGTLDAAHDPRNPQLVQRLKEHFKARGFDTQSTRHRAIIGGELGYKDQTAVYRYLAGLWTLGDLGKFESRLAGHLDNETRIEGGAPLVDDPDAFINDAMTAFLDQARAAGYISVAFGPAGTGKSCACRNYVSKNKGTTLYLHLNTWTRGQTSIVSRLLKASGIKIQRGERPEERLARHLQEHGIMLVLDNAQRLTRYARDWLRDLLDRAGIPIVLVGNPEIVGQWAAVDQHRRVVGLKRDVSTDLFDASGHKNTSEKSVSYLLKQHFPEGNAAVKKEALKLLTRPDSGAAGAVVMHCSLARRMIKGGKITDPAEAFRLASTQLIQQEAA